MRKRILKADNYSTTSQFLDYDDDGDQTGEEKWKVYKRVSFPDKEHDDDGKLQDRNKRSSERGLTREASQSYARRCFS